MFAITNKVLVPPLERVAFLMQKENKKDEIIILAMWIAPILLSIYVLFNGYPF